MPWRTAFPASLPAVTVEEVSPGGSGEVRVVCEELQWWQLVPRVGESNAMVWYDRSSGEPTMVRESVGLATPAGKGTVRIVLDQWTRAPGTEAVDHERIVIISELAPQGARWRSMTLGDHVTREGDAEFAANWSGCGGVDIVDNGRYTALGQGRFLTTSMDGIGWGVVRLTVGGRAMVCLRALDLPDTGHPQEIGQPLIDLGTGRTVAYWQYRPTEFDQDADSWLAEHPDTSITVDDRAYQRRNCTGRDEIMFTAAALGIEVGNTHLLGGR